MALIYNATFDKSTRKLAFEDKAGNEIYSCTIPERTPMVDDITKPLTFRATQNGSTVKLKKNGSPTGSFQTSRDGGNTWADYTLGTAIPLNTGDKVSFRAKADRTQAQNYNNYFQFMMEGKIEAWHNVMSLYRTSDFSTHNTVVEYAFYRLFQYCTSLTKAPVFPATTLADSCYYDMFGGCESLTKAPELPATTLAQSCYNGIFYNCSSLTESPVLPATTLANDCYGYMFSGCRRLNEVHCQMPSSYSSSTISSYAKDWLRDVSSTGTFYTNADANWPSGASGIPTGWNRVNEEAPAVDDIAKPLTFKATQDGSTVKLTKSGSPSGSFQTSRDGGNTWTDYTIDSAITLNTGDEVSFRAKADRTSEQNDKNYFSFTMTGKIEAWHNVMSLYRTNDFATYNTVLGYSFYRMFGSCTSLTKAPALPATTLAQRCYYQMFMGCRTLTKAPELPATTLSWSCYAGMFKECTSLTKAPVLPATTLAEYCYSNMFLNCTSITKAPALPATTLYTTCYGSMFDGCTSLTKAPELTATTLASSCYYNMFNGCSSLNEVHCQMPSTISTEDIPTYTVDGGSGKLPWLSGVASTGTFYTNADANWPSGASGIPTGWNRVNEEAPAVDDIAKPLTFKATQDGSTVKLTKRNSPAGAFQTSRDGGNTWTDYTIDSAITLNTGDEVSFRAKTDRTSAQTESSYFYFEMTGEIDAWHNVMSLYRTNDFSTYNTVVNYAFYSLFKDCTSLTKAPVLPATTLANGCYSNMFHGCTSLTKAPVLPATDLNIDLSTDASSCYDSMFYGCTSLTEAPELPATRLNRFCYYSMFYGCTSLTKAPELPATTLEESCYESMFSGCTSLTEAPELPATSLAFDCYSGMFNYCTSLVNAPALPATTLKSGCYNWMFARCIKLKKSPELTATKLANRCYNAMFYYCGSLNEVRCQIPSTISAEDIPKYTTNGSNTSPEQWLRDVSSTGTFYTNADANWPSGASGIPTGWTRTNT